ncbi:hypothetical protein GKQ77_25315 [Streptomyces sp. BG9H]|uniref:Transcriptional regulator n=1 Tax=Streptomyces anatolicus TaxID=2675858 RepID=A0ABS6YTT5_9ACTN|nr:hypothetical protein [Streptomyces anatolicus]
MPARPAVREARPQREPGPAKRRRVIALAAAGAAAVVGIGSAALALNGGDDDGRRRNETGASAQASPEASAGASSGADGHKDPADEPEAKQGKGKPSSSPSRKASPRPGDASSGERGGKGPASLGQAPGDDLGAPIAVRTRPYVYESPCSQRFLVNRKPHQVPQPPAVEQDAPGWAADLGAVSAGEQLIEVTVQGLSKDTVVLQGMNVRVQSTSSPLAWNDFQMGVGCGGRVSTKSFAVDLDDGAPRLTPKAGQRDFPYKVSEDDPEVFYVKADVEAHDVRWYLELEWSSGKRHNVLRIDDQGKPFRTSGNEGRPTFGWPLGGSKWEAPLGS